MISTVYLLQHSYEVNGIEETKLIGIFRTKEKAIKIIEYYKTLPGFEDYQNDFYVDEYEIDKNHWDEGFIKSDN